MNKKSNVNSLNNNNNNTLNKNEIYSDNNWINGKIIR